MSSDLSPCCKASSSNSSDFTCCRTLSESTALVLPHRTSATKRGSVWAIDEKATAESKRALATELLKDNAPLEGKCAVGAVGSGGTDGCCQNLKGDDRTLINPDIIRDIVIGLSDGLTVPFALTAGLSALGDSRIVAVGGLAELVAGAISMGCGGFLSAQAERDQYRYLKAQTYARVLRSCSGEMEREVHSLLEPFGVDESVSSLVTENLRKEGLAVAGEREGDEERGGRQEMLADFLVKFGEGGEETKTSRMYQSAGIIGISYFIGGLLPLVPYLCVRDALEGLMISCIVTVVVLLLFGFAKTWFSGAAGGFKGYAYGTVTTALVGIGAAGASYGIVRGIEAAWH